MSSSTLLQIKIILHKSFYALFAPNNNKKWKISEFVYESVTNQIVYLIRYMINLSFIFMNFYELNTKNKDINLHCGFYILFIHNQTKKINQMNIYFQPFLYLAPSSDLSVS